MEKNNYGFTSQYLTKNGRPYFAIMGEIHYSRYDRRYWKEALLKMKAGGVTVVSSYVIWIHHEEIEGEYDFSGNKDVGAFCRLCGELGLELVLRIGPWSHGEVRNGGFPDWLMKKGFPLRENNSEYFAAVEKYYKKIYEQVSDCFLSLGGAIMGVQIENEYGHCGGLTGDEGNRHINTLRDMAKRIGFDVPIYTATGWGGAMTGDLLPVMGGYCASPWDQRLTEIEPSGNYIFTHERNDHNIGSDHRFGTGITFDISKYPYLTAELGGGNQVTHHRRPVVTGTDIGAMSMVKLGSGVNLLGYYMYHGGTNPKGKLTTLQESRATGYLNDLPEYSYDFNAPIKEYGQISDTYKEIKLLAMFTESFGEELCRTHAEIPEDNPLFPTNTTELRHSVRINANSGYVFVNNYQRRRKMAEHQDVVLKAGGVEFPPIEVKDRDYFFFPFNMPLGGAVIEYATAVPLCRLNDSMYVFYSIEGIKPVFNIKGEHNPENILCITREQAKNAYKIKTDKERLIFTENAVINDDGYILFSGERAEFSVFPPFEKAPVGFAKTSDGSGFDFYEKIISVAEVKADFSREDEGIYRILLSYPSEEINDCFIHIDYRGDSAKLFVADEQKGDNFYTHAGWDIGLKQFGFPKELSIEIQPLFDTDAVFLERKPSFENGKALSLDGVSAKAEYCTKLVFDE